MPEIDENEYAEWTRHKVVLERIGKSEEAKKLLQKAVLIGAPDMAGAEPRVRAENEVWQGTIERKLDDFLTEQRTEREERKAAEDRRKIEGQWGEGRASARDAGYTDDGLEKLEAYMEKEGIANHRHAMAAFERENPPPTPVATGSSRWNFFDQRDAGNLGLDALLKGDDEAFLAQALPAALKEGRGG